MPYVFYEVLPEGMEEVDVVERSEHEQLLESLRTAETMRDEAIDKAVELEKSLHEQKRKYAETFLTKTPEPNPFPDFEEPQHSPQTFNELFNM